MWHWCRCPLASCSSRAQTRRATSCQRGATPSPCRPLTTQGCTARCVRTAVHMNRAGTDLSTAFGFHCGFLCLMCQVLPVVDVGSGAGAMTRRLGMQACSTACVDARLALVLLVGYVGHAVYAVCFVSHPPIAVLRRHRSPILPSHVYAMCHRPTSRSSWMSHRLWSRSHPPSQQPTWRCRHRCVCHAACYICLSHNAVRIAASLPGVNLCPACMA